MPVPRPIPGQILTQPRINRPRISSADLISASLTGPTITGGALAGTFTGNPTFSGDPTFSGSADFTGGIHATRSSRSPIQFYDGDTPPSSNSLYQTLHVGGLQIGKGANAPTLTTFRGNLQLNAFTGTGSTTQQGFFTFRIPHTYLMGSTPVLRVNWSHIVAAPTGNVKWTIEVSSAQGESAGTFPAATSYTATQAAGTQYAHHTTGAMTLSAGQVATLEPNTILVCRLSRNPADAADTFANNAFLTGVSLRYEVGQVGTKEASRTYSSIS